MKNTERIAELKILCENIISLSSLYICIPCVLKLSQVIDWSTDSLYIPPRLCFTSDHCS